MRRFVAWVAVLVSLASLSVFVRPDAASAKRYYPSGCRRWTYGGFREWKFNCWLSQNGNRHVNRAKYVYGVQLLLQGYGYNTGGNDGIFGPSTDTAVRQFQFRNMGRTTLTSTGSLVRTHGKHS